ncbi:class I SAM-dependent methyltransferase [Blastopirellula retiformator]|uniref:Uncharacterized protein n=1 Tax=Blastopirellula retiformator TaxID=2527970 RepID=A0A5C5V9Q0_9BACT|nr:class I SAM-dependent methyltransferase [Blastopirellula retiformator]TWT34599.1 hypothetical protein Enr8_20120 [Blastopirellula retiformator]
MTAIEFGSGRSTRWFSTLVGRLISIEHNADWYAEVRDQLDDNVDYRHIPMSHPVTDPERPTYDETPAYVAVADELADQSIDFAVVDGAYRTHCVWHLIPKIAPGGYLLLDDVGMWPSLDELAIPADWSIADDSTNGVKRCIIWQAPPAETAAG